MFMLRGELGQEARNTLPNLSRTGRCLMTVPKKKKKSLKLGSNSKNGG